MSLDYNKFINSLIKSGDTEVLLNHKDLSRLIYLKSEDLLGNFFKNYTLFKKRLYINKELTKVFRNLKQGGYINIYFFMNKYNYIPNINDYERILLENHLYHRVKKRVFPVTNRKAIFTEYKLDISFEIIIRLINLLTEINTPNFKNCIFVPFNEETRRFFKEEDILSFDICLATFNIDKKEINIRELFRFMKRNPLVPTSNSQLLPIIKRTEKISKKVGLSIEKNIIRISSQKFFDLFNKNSSYFFLPSSIYRKDAKFTIQKKISYYLFFLTQVKYIRKDKKPVMLYTIFQNTGINPFKLYQR